MLPASLEGLRVLELGAGIGRFTGLLAQRKARSVHAVDFMPNLIEEVRRRVPSLDVRHARDCPGLVRACSAAQHNVAPLLASPLQPLRTCQVRLPALTPAALSFQNERIHACLGNTSFEAADVMAMEFAPSSYDFVFTNWLFMYLNDAELSALAPRLLRSLTPGGRLFFRESCNKQSGDRSRAFNPSHYRTADHYTQLFESVVEAGGARLELESHGSVKTYVELKGNPNQIYWMWRRV